MKAIYTVFLLLASFWARADIICVTNKSSLPRTYLSLSTSTGLYSVDVVGFRTTNSATYKVQARQNLRSGTIEHLSKVEDMSTWKNMAEQLVLNIDYNSDIILSGLNLALIGKTIVFKAADCKN